MKRKTFYDELENVELKTTILLHESIRKLWNGYFLLFLIYDVYNKCTKGGDVIISIDLQ